MRSVFRSGLDKFDLDAGQAGGVVRPALLFPADMFSMLGVFGEFERSMIQERVRAGLRRAVAQGKVLGRPMVNGEIEKKVHALRAKGHGMIKIAKAVGIGVGTVLRMVKA